MPKRKKEKSNINTPEIPDQTKTVPPSSEVQSLLIKKMLAEIKVNSDPEHDMNPGVKLKYLSVENIEEVNEELYFKNYIHKLPPKKIK